MVVKLKENGRDCKECVERGRESVKREGEGVCREKERESGRETESQLESQLERVCRESEREF
jgi:hypothetical protein